MMKGLVKKDGWGKAKFEVRGDFGDEGCGINNNYIVPAGREDEARHTEQKDASP